MWRARAKIYGSHSLIAFAVVQSILAFKTVLFAGLLPLELVGVNETDVASITRSEVPIAGIKAALRRGQRSAHAQSSHLGTGDRGAMVEIPRGVFQMGSNDGEPAEQPVHRVVLDAFSMDRFETTNDEFAAFVSATRYVTNAERSGVGWHWDGRWREIKGANWRHPHGLFSSIRGLGQHPVVQVSWHDAQAYCRWREKRLPTEAEWERAARGKGDRIYPWGNDAPKQGTRFRASYGSEECCRIDEGDGYLFTAPVGSFPLGASPYGVQDLAGNVWEWVEDWFDPKFYATSPSANPVNRIEAKRKVIRGGGWGNNSWGLRSTLRHANPPEISLSMVGFRCVR